MKNLSTLKTLVLLGATALLLSGCPSESNPKGDPAPKPAVKSAAEPVAEPADEEPTGPDPIPPAPPGSGTKTRDSK